MCKKGGDINEKNLPIILLSLILLSSFLYVLIGLKGCYDGYSGEYPNLYTVAINSILWNNGYSYSADRRADPKIEVIDEDIYGRIMFTYYEKYYSGGNISFSALVICQYSNQKDVYYYEDTNYIIKEQKGPLNDFNEEEMEQLKTNNDWNQKMNLKQCIKKKITTDKPTIPHEKEVKNKIIDEFHLENEDCLFVDFLTSDSNNNNFIIYGYIYINEICFIGLVENSTSIKNINFLIPSNVYDYKTELVEFKKSNNWV